MKWTAPKIVSMRFALSEWKKKDALFDIGRRMETVTGRSLIFYIDQQTNREYRPSEIVDDVLECWTQKARYGWGLNALGKLEVDILMSDLQKCESSVVNNLNSSSTSVKKLWV